MNDVAFVQFLLDNPPNYRREGTGRHTFPIARIGGLCAVEGCEDMGVMRRQSVCGEYVHYCAFHEIVAHDLFDLRPATEREAA